MRNRAIIIAIIAFLLMAILIIVLDRDEINQIAGKASWGWSAVALAISLLSYVSLTFAYVLTNQAFKISIRLQKLFVVGFVSTALSNIVTFLLGAAAHSMRVVLLRRDGVDAGEILAASIFHSFLNNISMFMLLAAGLLWLLSSHSVAGGGIISLAVAASVLVAFLILATAMFFGTSLRSRILRLAGRAWHFLTRRDVTAFLSNFDRALAYGVSALRGRRLMLTALLGLMAGDWVLAAVALWFCFYALGSAPAAGVLLSGFGIGISAGNLSQIPGGLGIQEASMAGVFALLGTPFAQAVLAAIFFRVVYDFIPFLMSLALYARLTRARRR